MRQYIYKSTGCLFFENDRENRNLGLAMKAGEVNDLLNKLMPWFLANVPASEEREQMWAELHSLLVNRFLWRRVAHVVDYWSAGQAQARYELERGLGKKRALPSLANTAWLALCT